MLITVVIYSSIVQSTKVNGSTRLYIGRLTSLSQISLALSNVELVSRIRNSRSSRYLYACLLSGSLISSSYFVSTILIRSKLYNALASTKRSRVQLVTLCIIHDLANGSYLAIYRPNKLLIVFRCEITILIYNISLSDYSSNASTSLNILLILLHGKSSNRSRILYNNVLNIYRFTINVELNGRLGIIRGLLQALNGYLNGFALSSSNSFLRDVKRIATNSSNLPSYTLRSNFLAILLIIEVIRRSKSNVLSRCLSNIAGIQGTSRSNRLYSQLQISSSVVFTSHSANLQSDFSLSSNILQSRQNDGFAGLDVSIAESSLIISSSNISSTDIVNLNSNGIVLRHSYLVLFQRRKIVSFLINDFRRNRLSEHYRSSGAKHHREGENTRHKFPSHRYCLLFLSCGYPACCWLYCTSSFPARQVLPAINPAHFGRAM